MVATSSGVSVSGNELSKVVTTSTVTAPGGAIITGLDSKSVTISEAASRQLQSQIQLQQAQAQNQQQHPQHSNIILVRGSRSENGQIILQNTHELLSLLSDEDKPILLQHQRLKTKTVPEVTSTATAGNTILFQPTIKSSAVDGTFLLQSDGGLKKTTLSSEGGQIFLQQRLNKNGSSDGPILLRTLKRIDKSQSILVIRNATTTASAASVVTGNASSISASSSASAASATTIVKAKPIQVQPQQQQQHVQPATATSTTATIVTVSSGGAANRAALEDADIKKEPNSSVKAVQRPINLPLGTGEFLFRLPFLFWCSIYEGTDVMGSNISLLQFAPPRGRVQQGEDESDDKVHRRGIIDVRFFWAVIVLKKINCVCCLMAVHQRVNFVVSNFKTVI